VRCTFQPVMRKRSPSWPGAECSHRRGDKGTRYVSPKIAAIGMLSPCLPAVFTALLDKALKGQEDVKKLVWRSFPYCSFEPTCMPTSQRSLLGHPGAARSDRWDVGIHLGSKLRSRKLRQIDFFTSSCPESPLGVQVGLAKYAGQRVTLRLYQFLTTIRGPVVEGKLLGSAYWRSVDIHTA
jgi:hypothetical protein